MNLKNIWRYIVVAVFLCAAIQFSPLVLEENKIEPYFLGMPFTLWLGIIMCLLVILLTAIGGYVFSKLKSEELKED